MNEYWPGIDLVVVNYRTPGDLWGFLSSYSDCKPENPHSLHVVNVAPQEGDRDVVLDWARSEAFLYTEHEDNVGYATACNEAVVTPDREVLAFFNADTRLELGTVDECFEQMMAHPDWGVLGPRQTDEYGRITSAGCFGTHKNTSPRGWQEHDNLRFHDVRDDAITVAGSAYFVRRFVWDELTQCPYYMGCPEVWERKPKGAFLPTQHFYEETYLSYHAAKHLYKVVYYGAAKMIHRWHKATEPGEAERLYWEDSKKFFVTACEFHGMDHD